MSVREVVVAGKIYRGPMVSASPRMPWKISVYRYSGKMSESGSGCRTGNSWQRWKLFETEAAAAAAMRELEAGGPRG